MGCPTGQACMISCVCVIMSAILAFAAASVLPSQAESRIEALEAKLAGVYNLTGKLMAVEQMAAELGMEVPDLEVSV